MLTELSGRVSGGSDLSMEEMAYAIDLMMQGRCKDEEIGLLLMALRAKGETVDEVAGAAAAMRQHMTRIRSPHQEMIDTCGTGGSGRGTFNISTAVALVTAAAGVPVAKHGNRAITSKTGSADVLAELGVNVEASVEQVEACLADLGICFCFAPLMHQSMKHVGPVRKKLGVRTIFNLLGPLCNPAGASYQLLGVGIPEIRTLLAGALEKLGTRRALVVAGEDGMDEVSLAGATRVSEVDADGTTEFTWEPGIFGLAPTSSTEGMRAASPAESAEVIRGILDRQSGPARDIVALNAAAALWLAGKNNDPIACCRLAQESIDSGAAKELLAKLATASN